MVTACLHDVEYRYWIYEDDVIPLLEDQDVLDVLETEAEERPGYCINEGFSSGELHALVNGEYQVSGWWEIV